MLSSIERGLFPAPPEQASPGNQRASFIGQATGIVFSGLLPALIIVAGFNYSSKGNPHQSYPAIAPLISSSIIGARTRGIVSDLDSQNYRSLVSKACRNALLPALVSTFAVNFFMRSALNMQSSSDGDFLAYFAGALLCGTANSSISAFITSAFHR